MARDVQDACRTQDTIGIHCMYFLLPSQILFSCPLAFHFVYISDSIFLPRPLRLNIYINHNNHPPQAFNREEAVEEARLLRSAGAALHPDLGPAKNPWGSLKAIPEPNKVYGFYAVNAWLAGGFR
jgi:hypothetical protein